MVNSWAVIRRYDVLVLAAGIWFLAKFFRYAFPPLFEELKLTFEVSNAAIGTAFTGFMLIYALMQFPSGLLADRLGTVRVIVGGVFTAALGATIVVFGGPFALLVVAMLVMGAGTGAHKTVAIKLLALVYPARTGRSLGVFDTVGTFGGVVAPLVIAGLVAWGVDWRVLFVAGAVAGVSLGVSVAVRVPNQVPETDLVTSERSIPLREYGRPFIERRFFAFVVVTLGFSFAYNGVVAFLPLYLIQEVGTSTAIASLLYSVLFVVSIVQLLTGELADRIGRLFVIATTLGVATLSLGLLLAAPMWNAQLLGVPLLGALAVVGLGMGSHGFRPVRGVHLAALLPDALAGGGLGAVRTALMGAGAVAPAIIGLIADTVGFHAAFVVLFTSLAVASLLAVGLLLTE